MRGLRGDQRIQRLQEAEALLHQATQLLTDIELALPDDYNLFFGGYSPATEDAEKCIEYLLNRISDELERLAPLFSLSSVSTALEEEAE